MWRSTCYPGSKQQAFGEQEQPRAFVTDDDQGLLVCTWPRGGRPRVPTQYSDEVWTGVEYEVAGRLLYEGQVGPAMCILEATRARYDGRKQSPWKTSSVVITTCGLWHRGRCWRQHPAIATMRAQQRSALRRSSRRRISGRLSWPGMAGERSPSA